MVNNDTALRRDWMKLMNGGKENVLKEKFISLVPSVVPGKELFERARQTFSGEELGEVCAELILAVYADCERDDFHSWDYEHISFIIEASNEFDFMISENLINGLPQQLILRVQKKHLDQVHAG